MTDLDTTVDVTDPIWVFVDEIGTRVTLACRRWEALEEAAADHVRETAAVERDPHRPRIDKIAAQSRFADATDAFLSDTARLSLLLFPAPRRGNSPAVERTRARGDRIRRLLQVRSDDPLANRRLRDAFAHIDERLDAAVHEHGGLIARNYFETARCDVVDTDRVLRTFNTRELSIRILGEEHHLRPLRDAIGCLERALERALRPVARALGLPGDDGRWGNE
ncbi:MAG: hypothetical protein HYS27_19255 [Deltaproteobacteria bacterium]|nr:hypothetical protein [Deltaproteobacteria bacterium]